MLEARISRRDFLKLLGSGAVFFGAGVIGLNHFINNRGNATTLGGGSWSSASNTTDVGIHASLLAGGKVYYLAGSGFHLPQKNGPFNHAIWDPTTDTHDSFTLPEDLFCVGMCTLPNGNTLLAGGTLAYDVDAFGKFLGLKSAYEVDFNTGSVMQVGSMAHGRWYPTCVTLSDGKVFTVLGWDEYGCRNQLVEIYDPPTQSFSKQFDPSSSRTYCVGQCVAGEDTDGDGNVDFPDAGTICYGGSGAGVGPSMTLYPRMHLMPNGLIFSLGQGSPDWICNPSSGQWYPGGAVTARFYGTTVLCPLQNTEAETGKVLIAGGSPTPDAPTTNSCEIAEPSGATGRSRRTVASMLNARKHMSPVILPTGEIILFGGNQQGNILGTAVFTPEQFDPVSETWTNLPNASVPRLYHSVALLLQDGRVWNAGSTTANDPSTPANEGKEVRVEIFNPWYISETRPTISGDPTGGAYGETISIPTPDAADITQVSLVRISSITHHYNTDQRLIWLQILSTTSSSITVSAPINGNLAPPGMYLIHVLNSAGVPSAGKFIQIPGTSGPPPDTTLPEVAITSPEEGDTITGPSSGVTVNVAGTASDTGSGIQKVEVQVGTNAFVEATPVAPGDWSTWSAADTTTTEGTQMITARATDNAGNIKEMTVTVTISFTGGGGTFASIYAVTGTNSYLQLYTGSLKRVGEWLTTSSVLIGESIKKVDVILKKSGSPTGTINVVLRKGSDDSVAITFGSVDASTLTESDQTFSLTAPSSHTFAENDKVLLEWDGTGSGTDRVLVKRRFSSDPASGFDGSNTRQIHYTASYSSHLGSDLAGEWYKETSGSGDTTVPNVAITSPEEGDTITGPSSGVTVNVAGTASDTGSGIQKVEVQVGTNAFVEATPVAPGDWSTWSAADTTTTEGSHTITARAIDNDGNTSDTVVTITVSFAGGGTFSSIYAVTPNNSYLKLATGDLRRIGEWLTTSSVLIGESIKKVDVILKKSGSPTGTINVVLRKGSDDSVAITFGTIDAAILATSDQTFSLTAPSSHTLASDDKILVEWDGTGSNTDQVLVKRRFSSDPSTGFDNSNTRQIHQYTTGYSSNLGSDLAGEWYKET